MCVNNYLQYTPRAFLLLITFQRGPSPIPAHEMYRPLSLTVINFELEFCGKKNINNDNK